MTKRMVAGITFAAALSGVVVQAQTQSQTSAKTVTLSGCIAAATDLAATAAVAGGVTSSPLKPEQFVLNLMPVVSGTAGPAASSTDKADAPLKYTLIGNAGIAQWVGKRVEVTGERIEIAGTVGSAIEVAHPTAPPELRVVTIKAVEGDCK